MKCHIDGCDRDVMYKAQEVCQKHYFRFMRYGTYELTSSRKYRITTPNGYHVLYEPGHEMASKAGYVFEQRFVLFNELGWSIDSCEICGKEWSWRPYFDHVDHIDNDKTNNKSHNLRPLCNACNVSRGRPREIDFRGRFSLTIGDKTMTPNEWSREDGVKVCGATIRRRMKMGWDNRDCVYGAKLTHNGNG